jgi:hypothetical protein
MAFCLTIDKMTISALIDKSDEKLPEKSLELKNSFIFLPTEDLTLSKNKLIIQKVSKNIVVILPKISDIKNPTQVDVHNVQLIKSPKNFECAFIHIRWFSKIAPQTSILVIP